MALGTQFVKSWIVQKIENQIGHLEKLKANRDDEKAKILNEAIKLMIEQKEAIEMVEDLPIGDIRNSIEGHEGTAGRIYFKALGDIIPSQYKFKGRSKNPATDMFNCMLNYAYGILYSNVEIGNYKEVVNGYYPNGTKYKARCVDCCYRNIC